jgi:hypothetical protein
MIEQPQIAARTAGYFWKIHDLNTAADAGDFAHITKKINGSLTGEAEREQYWLLAKALLAVPGPSKGVAPGPAPNQVKVVTTPGRAPGSVAPTSLDGVNDPLANRNLA